MLFPVISLSAATILVILGYRCQDASAQESSPNVVPSMHDSITNPPPIAALVMRYKYGNELPELCLFRSQKNAFFARITRAGTLSTNFNAQDTFCGHWGGDYWYYSYRPPPVKESPEAPLSLFTYSYTPLDTNSHAYEATRFLEERLLSYTTCGIAMGDCSAPIRVEADGRVVYRNIKESFTITAEFEGPSGHPSGAALHIVDRKGQRHEGHVSYSYEAGIASGRIPAYIKNDAGYTVEVLSIRFGREDVPLPKESFVPPLELLAQSVEQIVHSNRTEYLRLGGKLFDMVSDRAERRLREGKTRDLEPPSTSKRLIVIALLVGFPAALVVVAMRRVSRKHQTTTTTQQKGHQI